MYQNNSQINQNGQQGSGKLRLLTNYHQLKFNQDIYSLKVELDPVLNTSAFKEGDQKIIEKQIYQAIQPFLKKQFLSQSNIQVDIVKMQENQQKQYEQDIKCGTHEIDNEARSITISHGRHILPSEDLYKNILSRFFRIAINNTKVQNIQRKFFDTQSFQEIPNQKNLSMFRGYEVSSNLFGEKLLINIDSCFKVVRTDTILQLLNQFRNNDDKLNEEIVGKITMTLYNVGEQKKFYKIKGIRKDLTPTSTFEQKGQQITYQEYYKTRYSITIKDLIQPLLHSTIKNKRNYKEEIDVFLIPELLVTTGLTDQMRNDFRLMQEVAKITKPSAADKIKQSQAFITKVANENQTLFNKWGLQLNNQPEEVPFTVLPQGNMLMGQGKQINLATGNLDRDTQHMIFDQKQLKLNRIALFYDARQSDEAQKKFLQTFQGCIKQMNIPNDVIGRFPVENAKDFSSWQKTIQSAGNPETLDFAILILTGPKKKGFHYDNLKRFLINEFPIPCQMILADTIIKGKNLMSIIFKLLLQIASKAQGIPWSLNDFPFQGQFCMTIGIDVYHCTGKKSILALAATTDNYYGRYYSDYIIHDESEELGATLQPLFQKAIYSFCCANRSYPRHIVVFRDSVSNGGIKALQNSEIRCLKPAYEQAISQTPSPLKEQAKQLSETFKYSYILVNKRVPQKFYQCRGDDIFKSSSAEQGTLVDSKIVSENEYFIVAHKAKQGTANPIKYSIAETNHNQEELKQVKLLTFKLCFMHFNQCGAIKIPAPCNYAHILANFIGDRYQLKDPKSLIKPHDRLSKQRVLYYI